MKFSQLEQEVAKYMFSEDPGMLRASLASMVACRMKIGSRLWMVIVGPSSSGKSQILRPLAMTDAKFVHQIDDLSENSFLSGSKVGAGGGEVSLLKRIGSHGMVVISDFTVIFSKNVESKNAILAQLRTIYDGHMQKIVGNASKPIQWSGYLSILAGCTPSIYREMEEIASMGERLLFYRMKPTNDEKATRLALARTIYDKDLDQKLSDMYGDYIKDAIKNVGANPIPMLSDATNERILQIALFAAKLRTPAQYDKFAKAITHVPISEMAPRVALQLKSLAQALSVMTYYDSGQWELSESDIQIAEHVAYSLASEERRACLRVLAGIAFESALSTSSVADPIGLNTDIIRTHLQHLAAIGVVERSGNGEMLSWRFKHEAEWKIVRRLESIVENTLFTSREATNEEVSEQDEAALAVWAGL
jgi:hypothetical protein